MTEQLNVLFKILILSAIGSAVVKYTLPLGFHIDAVPPSTTAALALILLPSLVLGGLLWWRSQQDSASVK